MSIWAISWATITLLFLGAFVHPFVTYPLSLWVVRRFCKQKPRMSDNVALPQTFSIVFCAYNEENVLAAKLENMREIQRRFGAEKIQVLVYNDCSTDRTLEILREYEPEIQVFTGLTRSGKSTGMNLLLEHATSDVVVFTDANVILSSDIIPEFADSFTSPDVGVVCGHLIYTNADTPTADVGTTYWKLEEIIKNLESETGSVMGADGSLFAIRRSLFRPVPADIIDDFFTSMSILADGYRIIRNNNAQAFESSANNSNDEYRRKVRIACRVFNCYRMIRPRIRQMSLWNQYKFYSHKWLRWLGAAWLLAASLSFCLTVGSIFHWSIGIAAAIVIAVTMGSFWLLSKTNLSLPGKVWSVWLGYWGTLHGVFMSMRGVRFQTWSPVASARKAAVRQS